MFNIVLVSPEIPPNTGNVMRLAANTGCALHLIRPLGFSLENKLLKRAGLDYREYADVKIHDSWQAFLKACQPDRRRMFAFSSHASSHLADVRFNAGDWLVFGCESHGLDPEFQEANFSSGQLIRLPMMPGFQTPSPFPSSKLGGKTTTPARFDLDYA